MLGAEMLATDKNTVTTLPTTPLTGYPSPSYCVIMFCARWNKKNGLGGANFFKVARGFKEEVKEEIQMSSAVKEEIEVLVGQLKYELERGS